jgi:hypothetical protein
MSDPTQPEPGRLTRLVATLVLIPTVPLLLGSVAALVLFYLAPGRFSALLARLPGDELIRSILIFAPATLLAVVVLAVLYALDQPLTGPREEAVGEAVEGPARRLATWGLLVPGLPLLVIAVGLWLFSFIAPDRFGALIEPLPGDTYLRLALRGAPILLLAVVLPAAVFLLFGSRRDVKDTETPVPSAPIRWGVSLTLLATLPLLLLSLAALGFFLFQPGRFDDLMAHMTQETFVRLALVFTPAILLSLVLLAVLFLFFSRARPTAPRAEQGGTTDTRQGVALWVLTSGLTGSAVVALGLLGLALYLLLR